MNLADDYLVQNQVKRFRENVDKTADGLEEMAAKIRREAARLPEGATVADLLDLLASVMNTVNWGVGQLGMDHLLANTLKDVVEMQDAFDRKDEPRPEPEPAPSPTIFDPKVREEDQDEHEMDGTRPAGYGIWPYKCKCGLRSSNYSNRAERDGSYRNHLRAHGIIPAGMKR